MSDRIVNWGSGGVRLEIWHSLLLIAAGIWAFGSAILLSYQENTRWENAYTIAFKNCRASSAPKAAAPTVECGGQAYAAAEEGRIGWLRYLTISLTPLLVGLLVVLVTTAKRGI